MQLDGPVADAQLTCDHLTRMPFHGKIEHLALAGGKVGVGLGLGLRLGLVLRLSLGLGYDMIMNPRTNEPSD